VKERGQDRCGRVEQEIVPEQAGVVVRIMEIVGVFKFLADCENSERRARPGLARKDKGRYRGLVPRASRDHEKMSFIVVSGSGTELRNCSIDQGKKSQAC